AQAHEVQRRLAAAHAVAVDAIAIQVIKTTGDAIQNRPLVDIGGKGLFTKEIGQALLDDPVDGPGPSAKDIPGVFPDGLVLPACRARTRATPSSAARPRISVHSCAAP